MIGRICETREKKKKSKMKYTEKETVSSIGNGCSFKKNVVEKIE